MRLCQVAQVRREPVMGDRVDLVFVIDEGKRYAVSEVALEGNTVFHQGRAGPRAARASGKGLLGHEHLDDEKMIAEYYGSAATPTRMWNQRGCRRQGFGEGPLPHHRGEKIRPCA